MKQQAPKFVNDLYRDMRDRRLLLPAIVLVVALIAVPVLLSKPAEPAPLPAAAPAGSAGATAVSPAVLVDSEVNVRDYRERLAKLKAKNPFEQRFTLPGATSNDSDATATDETAATDVATGDTGTTVPGTDTPAAPDTGTSAPPADTGTDVSTGTPTDPTDNGDSSDEPETVTEIRFLAGRVDITMGPLHKAREYDNVKYLTFLPDDADPIATFVGLTESGAGKEAVFAISSLVEVGDGDGSCSPHKPAPCQFLTLKAGEQRHLKYDGKTYRLKVRDTHVVEVKDPREQNSEGDDSATDGTTDGGDDTPGGQSP